MMTGFGDPADLTNGFSRFSVLLDSSGSHPDWIGQRLEAVHLIPGTSAYMEQPTGYGPASINLRVEFRDRDAFTAFRARTGSVGTLVLVANRTSHRGVVKYDGRVTYEHYPNTTMLMPTDVRHQLGGEVECSVAFRRREVL